MREIKFRAWNKNWDMMSICKDIEFDSEGDILSVECLRPSDVDSFYQYIDIDDAVLMQYIGLKDQNSKEIYEGDIIQDKSGRVDFIEYVESSALFSISSSNSPLHYYTPFKVIGNIYDNPELLTTNN